jgi:hypothetical protein
MLLCTIKTMLLLVVGYMDEVVQVRTLLAIGLVDGVRWLRCKMWHSGGDTWSPILVNLDAAADQTHSCLAAYPNCAGLATRVRTDCACAQVCADSVAEARRDADALSARHATLRRRLRQLYGGYRALRYRLQDDWPAGAGSAPPRVAHEDAVLGGTLEDIIR